MMCMVTKCTTCYISFICTYIHIYNCLISLCFSVLAMMLASMGVVVLALVWSGPCIMEIHVYFSEELMVCINFCFYTLSLYLTTTTSFRLTLVLPLVDMHTKMLGFVTISSWCMYFNMQVVYNFVVTFMFLTTQCVLHNLVLGFLLF